MVKKEKEPYGKGFRRTQRQWENSITRHAGKFIDKLTLTDALNLVAFGAGSYATYRGIEAAAAVGEALPDWLKIISPLSPFLYQLVIPTETAKNMTALDRIALALLGGYSTIKFVPALAAQIAEQKPPVVPGA